VPSHFRRQLAPRSVAGRTFQLFVCYLSLEQWQTRALQPGGRWEAAKRQGQQQQQQQGLAAEQRQHSLESVATLAEDTTCPDTAYVLLQVWQHGWSAGGVLVAGSAARAAAASSATPAVSSLSRVASGPAIGVVWVVL
jgi:hypothetical protein